MRETKPTGAFASAIRVLCTCTIMGALTTAALLRVRHPEA